MATALAQHEREIAAIGAQVASISADVSSSADVKAYVEAALARFGRIDGLFNNAGIEGHIAPTGSTTKTSSTASPASTRTACSSACGMSCR